MTAKVGVDIYTDGSFIERRSFGSWAFLMVANDTEVRRGHGDLTQARSSYQVELFAVVAALRTCVRGVGYRVLTDCNSIVQVAAGATGRGHEAKLWDEFRVHRKRLSELRVVWIRGHSGDRWNSAADRTCRALARGGARRAEVIRSAGAAALGITFRRTENVR